MKIQVRSVLNIAKILSSRKVYAELPELSTLQTLLRELTGVYGQEFYDAVCDENGYADNKVSVLVNGRNAAVIGGVQLRLNDGDDVLIMPVISGG